MGGMFSVVKIRDGIARGDYKDPGDYKHPPGSVAYEYTGPVSEPARKTQAPTAPPKAEFNVVKPGANSPQHKH
jgi:hypothetical protein